MAFLMEDLCKFDENDITLGIEFLKKIGNTIIDMYSILEISISLGVIFLLRVIIWFLIKKQNFKTYNIESKKLNKFLFFQVLGSSTMELALSYIISFIIIIVGEIPHTQYLVCILFIPALTFLVSIFIDVKFLLPLVQKNSKEEEIIKFLTEEKKNNTKRDKKEKKKESNNSQKDALNSISENNNEKEIAIMDKEGLLTEEVAESDDFKEIIINFINDMKKEISKQGTQIDNMSQHIDSINTTLNVIKESEMINKKIELKKLIYDCLNKGFATPEENDKITSYYYSYTSLGGNGEVKELYENHYLKLPIHDDNRKSNYQDEIIDRRGMYSNNYNKKYAYGEFDTLKK